MPLKPEAGLDFASILNAASQTPQSFENLGKDLPDGFPFTADPSHKVITSEDDGIVGATSYDYKIHRKVFTIFRPWEHCARCTAELAAGTADLPKEGDYACPHVTLKEYETVINDILSAKLIFGSEQEITQKDGSVLVSLRWYEKIPIKKKKAQPGVDGTTPEPSL